MSRTLRVALATFAILVFAAVILALAKPNAQSALPQKAQLAAQQSPPRQLPPLPPGYVRPPMNAPLGLAPKMRAAELPTADSHAYEVRLGTGDEILPGLTEFAEKNHVVSAHITGIGGLISAKLGWGSPTVSGMKEIDVTQKCELVSLIGNISERNGHSYVHLHAVVAFSDGSTKGGHVIEAHVDPIAEIYIVTTGAPLTGPLPGAPGH